MIYRARPKRRTWWTRLSDGWHNWPYYYRRYLGWLLVQCCIRCGSPFWGGLPRPGWRAWFQEYCSSACHEADNPPDRSAA